MEDNIVVTLGLFALTFVAFCRFYTMLTGGDFIFDFTESFYAIHTISSDSAIGLLFLGVFGIVILVTALDSSS